MRGRTVVITGATSGIGRAAADVLAERGATLGLVARNPELGERALGELRQRTGNDAIRLFLADLSSQQEVRRLADELLDAYPQIHVLFNNAGVVNLRRETTVDGYETTFAVNHLAYYLLTRLLLGRIRASSPARIVNVASDAHRASRLDWDDLQSQRSYRAMGVYGRSKLANLLITSELARRLDGTGVTVNAAHPGWVGTGFGANNGLMGQLITSLASWFARTPEKGAETPLWLATSPDLDGVSGQYFYDCREHRSSRASHEADAQQRLWKQSAELVGLPPEAAQPG